MTPLQTDEINLLVKTKTKIRKAVQTRGLWNGC